MAIRFLCITLFYNVFFQCMKFQVDSFSSFEDVAQTKKIQIDY